MTATRTTDPRRAWSVTHRRYVPYSHAHYGGSLVDGAYVLGMFGDVATEVCIRTDGDEGLFASYERRAVPRAGTRRRRAGGDRYGDPRGPPQPSLAFEARVVCRARTADRSPPNGSSARGGAPVPASAAAEVSAAEVLDPPIVAVTATGTVVVPPR